MIVYPYSLNESHRLGVSDPLCLDSLVRRSHVSIWKWIQLFGKNTLFHRRRVTAFLVDETYIRIGRYEAWVWIAIDRACT